MFKKKKIKVSTKEMGEVLCYLAYKRTIEFIEDKNKISDMGLDSIEDSDLFLEIMIINMFGIIEVYNGSSNNQGLENEVLDNMNYGFIKLALGNQANEKQINDLHTFISERYKQYSNLIQEYDSTSIQQLAKAMFYNIKNEELIDALVVFEMSLEFKSIIKYTADILKKYMVS